MMWICPMDILEQVTTSTPTQGGRPCVSEVHVRPAWCGTPGRRSGALSLLFVVVLSQLAISAPPPSPAASPRAAAKGKTLPGITPEREAAAMTFVKGHHPELFDLLRHLKQSAPREYERAIRELFRTSERLAQIQERDQLAYELAVRKWQAQSRAQVLAAKLKMSPSPELEQDLRSAIQEAYDVQVQILRRDREKAEERVRQLSEQIDKLQSRRESEVDRQWRQWTSEQASPGKSDAKSKAKLNTKSKVKVPVSSESSVPQPNSGT